MKAFFSISASQNKILVRTIKEVMQEKKLTGNVSTCTYDYNCVTIVTISICIPTVLTILVINFKQVYLSTC